MDGVVEVGAGFGASSRMNGIGNQASRRAAARGASSKRGCAAPIQTPPLGSLPPEKGVSPSAGIAR
jgi:Flp pilus assembly protein TadG